MSTATRRAWAAIAAVTALLTVMTLGAPAAPAHAATELLISTDGVTWGPTLPTGLFDNIGAMVPMDTVTSTFYVKNPTADPASLRVSVQDLVVTSPVLASSMTLTSWDDGSGITNSVQLNTLSLCDVVVPVQTILGGAVVRIDLTITMQNVTGLTAQDKIGSIGFRAAMRDLAAGPFPSSACDDDGVVISSLRPTQMAYTGTKPPTDWLVAAGALLGFGILLVAGRRRKRRDEVLDE